jgi:hypothetical protein
MIAVRQQMRKQSFGSESTHNVILALGPNQGSPVNSNPTTPDSSIVPEKTHWACHKDILKSASNYFDAVFNSQFQEAEASVVFLPRGIFSASVLDDVLYYMYNKSIHEREEDDEILSGDRNLERLEQLESVYLAADYLGMDDLCLIIKDHIIQLTHGLVCYCHSCTLLIPQLLAFTGPNQQNDPRLSQLTHAILKLLIQDPEKTLPTYWSSESMAWLLTETESLHGYLEARLFEHVNKNNAIETLHGCFLSKNPKDEKKDHWTLLLCTQKRMLQAGSKLLADHFDFYCTKYPKLLSCVDGITYSFEFLDYLLTSMLNEMNDYNAISLYKGIVRSLMCRDTVQRTAPVKKILQSAKSKTIRYIATHLTAIKELDKIDKNVIEQLAQGINVIILKHIKSGFFNHIFIIDLVVPISTLLGEDDSKSTKSNKPGNVKRSAVVMVTKSKQSSHWNTKLRSRLFTIVFGQAALHFKVGQRVELLNRPVSTMGTILYVGKLDNTTGNHLGIELDRTGKR